jgi:hypothetical protein
MAAAGVRASHPAQHVVGPTGARTLLSGLANAYSADIKAREEGQHLPPESVAANVDEFAQDGVVYDHGGVKVTAFAVEHGIQPAYGYASTMMNGRSCCPAILISMTI